MEPLTLTALAALVVKITSVLKAAGKDWNYVVTQAVTWVVGILVLVLAANADLTENLVLFDGAQRLGVLNGASLVLAGLAFSSLGSFAYDVKKAVDVSDSAAEQRLLPPTN